MRGTPHSWLLLAAAVTGLAFATPGADAGGGRWTLRGEGLALQAVWTLPDESARVSIRCDPGNPLLVLRIGAPNAAADLQRITLVADGLRMDYPVEQVGDGGTELGSRIALDAPALDRMLVAHRFAIGIGKRLLATGTPGPTLVRVVRACRGRHWPREARIEPSEAGLAKK